jgi:hypothetical protein
MGWKEAQATRKANNLTPPKDEDLIGRRVLNGLGLVERQLLPVCRRIFGSVDPDEGTWLLAKRLLEYAWQEARRGELNRMFRLEAHTISNNNDVQERLEMFDPGIGDGIPNIMPVIMTRIRNSKQSLTYTTWNEQDIGAQLTPPYNVLWCLDTDARYHTAVQDTVHFVKQFGPYDWSEWMVTE